MVEVIFLSAAGTVLNFRPFFFFQGIKVLQLFTLGQSLISCEKLFYVETTSLIIGSFHVFIISKLALCLKSH